MGPPARLRGSRAPSVIPGSGSRRCRQRRITRCQPADAGEPPRPDHQRAVVFQLGQVRVVTHPHRLTSRGAVLSRARTWSRRACRSRPSVVEYRRDLEAKCPRKPSMSAHRDQPLYGPSGPVSPAHPARNAVLLDQSLEPGQVRVRTGLTVGQVSSGLGRVLRHIRGDRFGVQLDPGGGFPVSVTVDGPGVDLAAEAQHSPHIVAVDRRRLARHFTGCPQHQVHQLGCRDRPGRGRERVRFGGVAVEPDQGVEVDDAAPLELGHLRELDPDQPPTRRLRDAEMAGEARGRARW